MTHEELLKKIKDLDGTVIFSDGRPPIENAGVGDRLNLALRAVVELHKPVQSYMFDEESCSHCSSEEDRSEILYPCPTIQAIEEELG